MEFIDLSLVSFFVPLLSFLVVFLLTFGVLQKTKVFEHKGWQIITSLLIASLFLSAVGPLKFVSAIVPWFAVFLVAFILVFILMAFSGSDKIAGLNKGISISFVIGLIIVFLITGSFVFSSYFTSLSGIWDWITTPRILGGIIFAVICGAVVWFLTKGK